MPRFIIVYGDKGLGAHNAGRLFEWSAATHKSEVESHQFPGGPASRTTSVEVAHISSVPDLVNDITQGPVEYLAYFGHSWSSPGVGSWLFIGETASAGSNLSAVRSDTEAPVTDIPKNKFVPGAQIRLFGCRAGYGPASIAAELHNDLGVTVFAYENSGGSLFTQDAALGHGQRAVTRADINLTKFETAAKTWLVPINGIPTFRRF